MKRTAIVLGVVAVLILALVLGGVGSYNGLVNASQRTDSQWAQVQNVYQRRADLIPNLVNTVAGAASFEKSTLVEVTNARASVGQVHVDANAAPADPAQLEKFEQAQGQLSGALSRLLVVAERYPDLKSNQNFSSLQAQLEGSENRIAVERGKFNDAVMDYNSRTQRFPSALFAHMFGFNAKPYFAGTPAAQTPPVVQFDLGSHPATAPAK